MKNTIVFTSTLPPGLLKELDVVSKEFGLPKNKILEKALTAYFEKIKRAEYIHSFRRAAGDQEVINMAEEGLEDYLRILDE